MWSVETIQQINREVSRRKPGEPIHKAFERCGIRMPNPCGVNVPPYPPPHAGTPLLVLMPATQPVSWPFYGSGLTYSNMSHTPTPEERARVLQADLEHRRKYLAQHEAAATTLRKDVALLEEALGIARGKIGESGLQSVAE